MPKIAIIGASYLQLPIYLKAKELKTETLGFAWAEGAVAKDYCTRFYDISTLEKEKILEVCIKEKIDGVLTIATDIAVPTVNYIANKLGLIGNSLLSSAITTNKYLMRQALQENFVTCPSFYQITNHNDLINILPGLIFPVIVKPVDRSGSKGVTKVNTADQLSVAVNTAIEESLTKTAIIESFITGVEVSVETISFKGRHHILAITDKITSGPPHFVELEHHQPSNLSVRIQDTIKKETIKALNALNIENGASHSEFIISDKEIYVTEVGARMGGDFIGSDLVYLSTGYDFLKGTIQVALNQFEEPLTQWEKNSGVLFYSVLTPKVKKMATSELVKPFVIQSEFNNALNLHLKQSSDRSGYFIYQSSVRISNRSN